jgi:PKD repeat protein
MPDTSPAAAYFTFLPTEIKVGQTVAFTDMSSNGPYTWLWDFSGISGSTSQNPTFAFSAPGVYMVSLYAANCAGGTSFSEPIYIIPDGIEEWDEQNYKISVFPNPASTKITVWMNNSKPNNAGVEILDVTGRLILQQKLENKNEMDVSSLSNGVYFVRISGDATGSGKLEKLVISR